MKAVILGQWRPHQQQSNLRCVGGRNQPNQAESWPPVCEDGHWSGVFVGSTWTAVAGSVTFWLIVVRGQLCLCHSQTPGQI